MLYIHDLSVSKHYNHVTILTWANMDITVQILTRTRIDLNLNEKPRLMQRKSHCQPPQPLPVHCLGRHIEPRPRHSPLYISTSRASLRSGSSRRPPVPTSLVAIPAPLPVGPRLRELAERVLPMPPQQFPENSEVGEEVRLAAT